jgi:hypothetical protein
VRLGDITPKKAFGKRKGQKTGVCLKQGNAKTGSSGEPVLRDTLNVAVNEGG